MTQTDSQKEFKAVPAGTTIYAGFQPRRDLSATLHQVACQTTYHNPSGFFAQLQAQWHLQSNQGYSPAIPGDEFWQLNVFAGYRFAQRKAELRVGLLNLTDQNYRLNPLTLYNELPRQRTLALRLQFAF